jgi:hypothetical protein
VYITQIDTKIVQGKCRCYTCSVDTRITIWQFISFQPSNYLAIYYFWTMRVAIRRPSLRGSTGAEPLCVIYYFWTEQCPLRGYLRGSYRGSCCRRQRCASAPCPLLGFTGARPLFRLLTVKLFISKSLCLLIDIYDSSMSI